MSLAVRRFQPDSCFVTILLCLNAAASRVGTNCCNLPCSSPAKLMWCLAYFHHFERSEKSLFGLVAPRHPAPRRRWAGCPHSLPSDKTAPPHTNHSYPSAPRRTFSAPPLRQRFLPAKPRRAETNSGYDNANVQTREHRVTAHFNSREAGKEKLNLLQSG